MPHAPPSEPWLRFLGGSLSGRQTLVAGADPLRAGREPSLQPAKLVARARKLLVLLRQPPNPPEITTPPRLTATPLTRRDPPLPVGSRSVLAACPFQLRRNL